VRHDKKVFKLLSIFFPIKNKCNLYHFLFRSTEKRFWKCYEIKRIVYREEIFNKTKYNIIIVYNKRIILNSENGYNEEEIYLYVQQCIYMVYTIQYTIYNIEYFLQMKKGFLQIYNI
jgi:hypothetical protein